MRSLLLICAYFLHGCVAPQGVHSFASERIELPPDVPRAIISQPVEAVKKTPRELALSFRTALECATNAKLMHRLNPRFAWTLYTECTKRKDFVDLYRMLAPPWLAEIKRRGKSGVRAVANVLANRGGDLKLDLAHVNDKGIQIFRLSDAVDSPGVFRGRYVLMRGKVVYKVGNRDALKLTIAELMLQSENINYGKRWQAKVVGRFGKRRTSAFRYGNQGHRYKYKLLRWQKKDVVHSRNITIETDNQVVGYMPRSNKALESEVEYLFLIKFAEIQEKSGVDGDNRNVVVAAVIDYFPPLTENKL